MRITLGKLSAQEAHTPTHPNKQAVVVKTKKRKSRAIVNRVAKRIETLIKLLVRYFESVFTIFSGMNLIIPNKSAL